MIDEIYDRDYRAGRGEFNSALALAVGHLSSSVRNAFEVLNRIEYSAPWTAPVKRARTH